MHYLSLWGRRSVELVPFKKKLKSFLCGEAHNKFAAKNFVCLRDSRDRKEFRDWDYWVPVQSLQMRRLGASWLVRVDFLPPSCELRFYRFWETHFPFPSFSSQGKVIVVKRVLGEGDSLLKNIAKEAKMLESLWYPNFTQFIGAYSKPVAIMMY